MNIYSVAPPALLSATVLATYVAGRQSYAGTTPPNSRPSSFIRVPQNRRSRGRAGTLWVVRGVESLPCAKSKDPAFGTCGRHELAAPPNSRSPVPRTKPAPYARKDRPASKTDQTLPLTRLMWVNNTRFHQERGATWFPNRSPAFPQAQPQRLTRFHLHPLPSDRRIGPKRIGPRLYERTTPATDPSYELSEDLLHTRTPLAF